MKVEKMTEKRLLAFGSLTPEKLNALIAGSDKDRRRVAERRNDRNNELSV
jgi:hypothetical protein